MSESYFPIDPGLWNGWSDLGEEPFSAREAWLWLLCEATPETVTKRHAVTAGTRRVTMKFLTSTKTNYSR